MKRFLLGLLCVSILCAGGCSLLQTNQTVCIAVPELYAETLYPGMSALSDLLFDSLLEVDATGEYIPSAALEYHVDGHTVRIKMRRNLKFCDGSAITFEDVKFSYETAMQQYPAWQCEISEEEDGTYLFSFQQPSVDALQLLTHALLPKARYEHGAAQLAVPIGSGPYCVEDYREGILMLRRFADYHSKDDYPVQKIQLQQMNAEAATHALQAHTVDVAVDLPASTADANAYAYGASRYLLFNTSSEPTMHIEVRQAIAILLSQTALYGAEQSAFRVAEVAVQSDADALLKKAGYRMEDGVYVNAQQPLKVQLLCNPDDATALFEARNLAERLQQAGILCKLAYVSEAGQAACVAGEAGEWHLALTWSPQQALLHSEEMMLDADLAAALYTDSLSTNTHVQTARLAEIMPFTPLYDSMRCDRFGDRVTAFGERGDWQSWTVRLQGMQVEPHTDTPQS